MRFFPDLFVSKSVLAACAVCARARSFGDLFCIICTFYIERYMVEAQAHREERGPEVVHGHIKKCFANISTRNHSINTCIKVMYLLVILYIWFKYEDLSLLLRSNFG